MSATGRLRRPASQTISSACARTGRAASCLARSGGTPRLTRSPSRACRVTCTSAGKAVVSAAVTAAIPRHSAARPARSRDLRLAPPQQPVHAADDEILRQAVEFALQCACDLGIQRIDPSVEPDQIIGIACNGIGGGNRGRIGPGAVHQLGDDSRPAPLMIAFESCVATISRRSRCVAMASDRPPAAPWGNSAPARAPDRDRPARPTPAIRHAARAWHRRAARQAPGGHRLATLLAVPENGIARQVFHGPIEPSLLLQSTHQPPQCRQLRDAPPLGEGERKGLEIVVGATQARQPRRSSLPAAHCGFRHRGGHRSRAGRARS